MSLADRLKQHPATEGLCPLGRLLSELEGDELAALKQMLGTREARGWDAPEIYEALKEEGHAVGFKAINKHRGGKCRCAAA